MLNTDSLKILIPWILMTTLAMMLAIVVGPTVGDTLGVFLGNAAEKTVQVIWKALPSGYLASMLGGALNALVGGIVIGGCQWLTLRHWVRKAGWWIVLTGLGNMIGGFLGSAFLNFVIVTLGGTAFALLLGLILSSGITALAITLPQWLFLISVSKKSFWWIPASLLGWVIGNSTVAIGFYIGLSVGVANVLINAILGGIGGLVLGVATGLALVYIVGHRTAV